MVRPALEFIANCRDTATGGCANGAEILDVNCLELSHRHRSGRHPDKHRDIHMSLWCIMKRLHIIGGKNHGKTTLVVDLVKEFTRRGVPVATVKHTHHEHELDVPGKDSHSHRMAGAAGVGILSPSMTAIFLPAKSNDSAGHDRYSMFASAFVGCRLMLVEGDSQAQAPKIEVWRKELEAAPLAQRDNSILAVVTDDPLSITAPVLSRSDVAGMADWILRRVFGQR
jgi:molybdopterin-guanine dinucleotide biosynthesis protein MobB